MPQKKVLRLLPYQMRLLTAPQPYLGMIGGTGTGKTWFSGIWLLVSIQQHPGHEWIVSAPTYRMMRRKPMRRTLELLDEYHIEFTLHRGDDVIEITEPGMRATIYFISAENPDRMQGVHAKGIVGDEAGLYTKDWWYIAVQRAGMTRGKVLLLSTPYYAGHWLKTEVVNPWLSGNPRFYVERPITTDNPYYPQDEVEEAQRTLPAWRFRMMYHGEFTRPEGLVYPEVDYVPRFDIPIGWTRIRGVDFGFNNPTAIVDLAKNPQTGDWYVYRVLKRTGMLTNHLVDVLKQDPFTIQAPTYCDPSGKEEIVALQVNGIDARSARNAVLPGILHVTSLIQTKKLHVFDDLDQIRYEFQAYRWRKDRSGTQLDEVVKEDDHLMDALRYGLYTYGDDGGDTTREVEPDLDFSNVDPKGREKELELLF